MAEKTTNYNLTKLAPGEDVSASGYAFLSHNLDTIDRVLKLGRDHVHTGASASVSDPIEAPTLVLDSTDGILPPGKEIRYRYTYVDETGAETAGSPEASVITPSPVTAPAAASLAYTSTGGTNVGGQYSYVLTAYVSQSTQETIAGAGVAISVPYATTTNLITVTFPSLPANADGWNVYRRGPNEIGYSFMVTLDSTNTFWDDTGNTTGNAGRVPPNSNLTFGANNVTVTLPGATPSVPDDVTWKIYRTYTASNWKASDLHHVIEETFDGSGIITPTFTDYGDGTGLEGIPEVSEIVGQPSKIDMQDGNEVQGHLPPGLAVVPHEVTFLYAGTLAVTSGTFSWRCPFDYAEIVDVTAVLGIGSTPNAQDVIIDVNKYDSVGDSWATIFSTQGNRPTVPTGDTVGSPAVPDVVDLIKGDMLAMDIDQVGAGTNTDEDLSVTVNMYIRSGSSTTSPTLPMP